MPPGPPNFSAPGGGGSGNAAQKVSIPATLMMILSGLAILVSDRQHRPQRARRGPRGDERRQRRGDEPGLLRRRWHRGGRDRHHLNAIVVFGAIKMKKLEGYTFALVSAILFTIPCSFCCVVNTPIGIWAIVTLVNAEVKAAFRS